jgi:sugar transferase EpsL
MQKPLDKGSAGETVKIYQPMVIPEPGWKRGLDLSLGVLGTIIFAPVMALVAPLILVFMGRPILFRQIRPGLHGKPFQIFKFRTMTSRSDEGDLVFSDNEKRLTPLGRLLRSTSLDELPELFNVLRGEMSIVGPRPLLMQYLERYSPEQQRRHNVKPGITGWAQVNGRNDLTWEEKFALDLWYVGHQSLWLDLKIILLTVRKVFLREGINKSGYVGMDEFMGSKSL